MKSADESHRIDIPTLTGLLAYLNYQYPATQGDLMLINLCKEITIQSDARQDLLAQIAVMVSLFQKLHDNCMVPDFAHDVFADCPICKIITNSPAAAKELLDELDNLRKFKEVLDEVNSIIEWHIGTTFIVNAIKEIYKEKKELLEQNERMRAALEKYAKHFRYCTSKTAPNGKCNCGLEQALSTTNQPAR